MNLEMHSLKNMLIDKVVEENDVIITADGGGSSSPNQLESMYYIIQYA